MAVVEPPDRPGSGAVRTTGAVAERRLGLLLLATAAGTNIPTVLLLIYQVTLDMSDTELTALFGVYAVGMVPALVLAGPAADRWGRRPVAVPAALLSAVASLAFVAAQDSVVLLFVIRFLQGATAGALFSVASAWLVETSLLAGRRTGARRAAVTMTGGFAIGPTVAGLIGQWGPWPLVLPYALHGAALLAAVLAVLPAADTGGGGSRREDGTLHPVFAPGQAGRAALVVAPLAVCVYAFPASAVGGVPLLVGFPVAPIALTGLLAGATLGAGALAAPLQTRLGHRSAATAAAAGAVGFALTSLAAAVPSLLLVSVPAAVLLGAGGGLALASSLARLPVIGSPGRLGTVSAAFYGVAYLGFGFPLLMTRASLVVDVAAVLAVLAALCALLTVQQARARF